MATSSSPSHNESTGTGVFINPSRLWRRFLSYLPSSHSNLFTKIWNLHLPISASAYTSRRRKLGLPLPLPSRTSLESSSAVLTETSRVFDTVEDILEHTISSLRSIHKSLLFWQSRAEGTDAQKIYFMLFERGPRAFIEGTIQLIHGYATERTSIQHLSHAAAITISKRIAVLARLQHCLATFLAQVYIEVDKQKDVLSKDPDKSLPSLLVTISDLFENLERSIGNSDELCKSESSAFNDGSQTFSLHFDKLPEINEGRSMWIDCEVKDSINLIYQNLNRLDSYLSCIVSRYRKPRRMTMYWMHYTCGAVGLSVCSIWLLRHSSLMGSHDINNWIQEASDSTVGFWKDHVEQPLISIRDELFETFKRRHKGVMELEEVNLTSNSLHRMLLAFSEQTKGEKLPENASDLEMLKIVMARYEKELAHPIQSLLGGELAHALLIQIQKLKLDIETAMLELNQILRANEINFAILAALPAFFLSLILLMLVRTWLKQDKGAEGKGRIARLQRRLLIVEVEKRIMHFQNCLDQGLNEDAQCMFGLVLYSLDRLYKAVERHAKETGEWLSLQQDIIDLGKPGLNTSYKLAITSRMDRVYDCLLPSTKGR